MTPPVQPRAVFRPRTDLEVALQQLQAVDRFVAACRAAEDGDPSRLSREERLDLARRREVRDRQRAALQERTDRQLRATAGPVHGVSGRRVVLAHRSAWFTDRLGTVLGEHGIAVVAQLGNGADAVGVVVAEQPDLLLVEDTLEMLPGEQVVAAVQEHCPDTVLVGHVGHSGRVGSLLDLGAAAVFHRQVPPVEVASRVVDLLGGAAPVLPAGPGRAVGRPLPVG